MSAAGASQTPQRACSAYAVIPMTGRTATSLPALEEPLALVAGDDLVEEALLGARVVQVVVDDVVAERRARHRPLLERRDRLAQGVREALGVRLVRIPFERGRQLELVLDPVEPGREERGEAQVGVH